MGWLCRLMDDFPRGVQPDVLVFVPPGFPALARVDATATRTARFCTTFVSCGECRRGPAGCGAWCWHLSHIISCHRSDLGGWGHVSARNRNSSTRSCWSACCGWKDLKWCGVRLRGVRHFIIKQRSGSAGSDDDAQGCHFACVRGEFHGHKSIDIYFI